MAFQPPNTDRERQNRKILEQLEEQKKRLRAQTQPGAPPTTAGGATPSNVPVSSVPVQQVTSAFPPMIHPDTQVMSPAQRTALQAEKRHSGFLHEVLEGKTYESGVGPEHFRRQPCQC